AQRSENGHRFHRRERAGVCPAAPKTDRGAVRGSHGPAGRGAGQRQPEEGGDAACPGPCPGESAWTPGASPCRLPSQAPGRDGPPRRRPPPPRAARRGAARHARQPPCESQELSHLEACSGHLGSSERSASRRRHAGAAKGGQLVNRRTASAGRTPAAAGRGGGLVPPQPVTTKDTCGAESSSAVRPNRPSAAESPTGGGALPQLACSGACRSVVAFQ
ncbi:unnamed protein product, partial [Prorocentrum cordatum]